ncbi:hypothetical protein D3C72_1294800 [compost metagenome]
MAGIGIHRQSGDLRGRCACRHAIRVGEFHDTPIDAFRLARFHLGDLGSDEPCAHGQHADRSVEEQGGIVGVGCFQRGIGRYRAAFLQGKRTLIPGFQEFIIAVHQRVFAILNARQLHRRTPGVQQRAINAVGAHAAFQLAGDFIELRPAHVIAGVRHARLVENILVVIDHPEIRAERQSINLAIDGQFLDQAAIGGRLDLLVLDETTEIGDVAGAHQIGVAGHILDGDDVDILGAAGQLRGYHLRIVLRAEVHHLERHIRMLLLVGLHQRLEISALVQIPQRPFKRDGCITRSKRGSSHADRNAETGGCESKCTSGCRKLHSPFLLP